MLSEDIRNLGMAMSELGGKVSPEDWDFIKNIKANLTAIADGVENLENTAFSGACGNCTCGK